MTLKLKGLTIKSGIFQSPMTGCTDLAFRLMARARGMEFAFAEMISAKALAYGNQKTLNMMKTVREDRPLGAQLLGWDPAIMAESAARIEEMGFDLLDINLACPAPKVTKGGTGAGSALLIQPEQAGRIFRAAVRAVRQIPVTVKMRLGYQDPSGRQAIEVGKRSQDAGVCAVTVHGRTRAQRYRGQADYEAIGRVKEALTIPVIGNGDIFSGEDAKRLVAVSRCDSVMIGRGALGNPWIYEEVEAALKGQTHPQKPSLEERIRTLLEHMELEVLYQGEYRALHHMRRIARWYVAGFPQSSFFRGDICKAKNIAEMRENIRNFRLPGLPGAPAPKGEQLRPDLERPSTLRRATGTSGPGTAPLVPQVPKSPAPAPEGAPSASA